MAIDKKYEYNSKTLVRDTRPLMVQFIDYAQEPFYITAALVCGAAFVALSGIGGTLSDLLLLVAIIYFFLVMRIKPKGAYRTPKYHDPKNGDGIMFVGNQKGSNRELWVSNSDARTHILYLGTTGSGKTEGLKSLVTNALTWGSGFVYVDGKADTDLWASIYALARRFGRDDDILVLNYMTGNSDNATVSNTMNPFSYGSASYLTNMMVGLMDDAGGDTAMWKGRAVSLMGALMPALTWRRDNEDLMLDVQEIREYLEFKKIVALSRNKTVPERIRKGLKGYLDTLPGYVDEAFDDNGDEKPPGPGNPGADMTVPRQQHGYLTMQFTRSLQSLADEYGHVFRTQLADIDMLDVVLNRRIMLVLIPALEKSGDEAANLGKIVAANIKGMMGATLGSSVEGDWESVIENKATRSASPFMTIFDEVGYYTASGMAVMAAQARSLGFCLIFAAQDLPALEKRVKEEARSITANCNIKIFGKLEDPTQTKDFFENTVGGATISKVSSFDKSSGGGYTEQKGASISDVKKASYGELKKQKEGEAHIAFMADTLEVKMFYANPKKVTAMRVGKYLRVNPTAVDEVLRDPAVDVMMKHFDNPSFSAMRAAPAPAAVPEFETLRRGWMIEGEPTDWVRAGALAIAKLAYAQGMIKINLDEKSKAVAADDDDDLAIDNLLSEFKSAKSKEASQEPQKAIAPPPKAEDDDDLAIDKLLAEFKASRGKTDAATVAPESAKEPPPPPAKASAGDDEDVLDFSSLFGTPKSEEPKGEAKPETPAEPQAEAASADDDLDFSALFGKSAAVEAEDDEDDDDLDFSALFGDDEDDEDEVKGKDSGDGGVSITPSPELPPPPPVRDAKPKSDIRVDEKLEQLLRATPSDVDIDEDLLPPEQAMTPFITDIMKRTGRALGESLFGSNASAA
jgi:intracellular multiplication protein IcmO